MRLEMYRAVLGLPAPTPAYPGLYSAISDPGGQVSSWETQKLPLVRRNGGHLPPPGLRPGRRGEAPAGDANLQVVAELHGDLILEPRPGDSSRFGQWCTPDQFTGRTSAQGHGN